MSAILAAHGANCLERGQVVTRVRRTGVLRLRRQSGKVVQVPASPVLVAAARAASLRCSSTAKPARVHTGKALKP